MIPLIDRSPTYNELERFRLLLSTFQDGTGMLSIAHGTLPGWRDFERTTALTFGGHAQESKAVFDVIIPYPSETGIYYGISCKMRRTLHDTRRSGRVNIEVSNSNGKFWDALASNGINASNYKEFPRLVGNSILNLVNAWHYTVSFANGGNIDISKSMYLVLLWDTTGSYQLYRFSLNFPHPDTLHWEFPVGGKRLIGSDDQGVVFEWYGESGGQLKYYPLASDATWISKPFQLEPLPYEEGSYSLVHKAHSYFPHQWDSCADHEDF